MGDKSGPTLGLAPELPLELSPVYTAHQYHNQRPSYPRREDMPALN